MTDAPPPIDADAIDRWLGRTRGGYDFWKMARLMATADTAAYFQEHMLTTPLFKSRAALHKTVFARPLPPGLVLEFGVAGGRSLNRLAQLQPERTVHGFDSFQGLPEAWRSDYQEGHFAQRIPAIAENARLVVGYFEDTLGPFLQSTDQPLALLHVDCDLYSSTRTVLTGLAERFQPGTIIVFDEYFNYPGWRQHEHRAFTEFIAETGLAFRHLGAVRSNKQVAVEITGG